MIFSETTAVRRSLAQTYFLSFFLLAGSGAALAQKPANVTRLEHADKEPQNWLSYYGNYNGWSYSQLNQITRENVKQLVPVWAFPAGFPPPNLGLRQGLESAALVVDGVLYFEGMQNNVYAVEAATGKELWNYTYKWGDKPIGGIKGARGLAYSDGRVYMGSQDNHLVALDAETGNELWNVEVRGFLPMCLQDHRRSFDREGQGDYRGRRRRPAPHAGLYRRI